MFFFEELHRIVFGCANLFAMNEAGTDKVLFTNADQNEVGIYLNNVSTKYVVALPVKKDEMLVVS